MTAPLRPMNLGEILDRSMQVYGRQFWSFITVAAVPALVVQAIALADAYWFHLYSSTVQDNHWTPGIYMTQAIFAIGYYHFASFTSFLLLPVILKLVSGDLLNEDVKVREAWRFFGARWGSYLWLAALELVVGLVIIEVLTAVLLGCTMEAFDALGAQSFLEGVKSFMVVGLWFSAGFSAFLWIGSSLSLAIPSAAFEGLRVFRALRRSWSLTTRSRLRIALAWVALAIAAWSLSFSFQWILRLLVVAVVRWTHARWIFYTLYPILSQTVNTALSTVLGPIYPIAITLFYYDQRIRREGYDIERLMESAGMTATLTPPAGEEVAAPAIAPAPFEVPPS